MAHLGPHILRFSAFHDSNTSDFVSVFRRERSAWKESHCTFHATPMASRPELALILDHIPELLERAVQIFRPFDLLRIRLQLALDHRSSGPMDLSS